MFTVKQNILLPVLSKELEDIAFSISQNQDILPRIQYRSGHNIFKIKTAGDVLEQWVRDNITTEYYKVGLQFTTGDLNPHIDGPDADKIYRNYVLLYTIQTGAKDGVDPATTFYTTPDGVEFNDRLVTKHLRYRHNPTHKNPGLDVVNSARIQAGTWSVINTQCAHSVDGVGSLRLSLSVSFTKDIMPNFIQEIVNG